jgi:hypothetical protein
VPVISTASGQLLVFFKETVGSDPEASQLTIDRDGSAVALTTLGGPGGEHRQYFTLDPARLRPRRVLPLEDL